MFHFPVDQSSNQLSEDPGFALLYVCAAVLSGVKCYFLSFEHNCCFGFLCCFYHMHVHVLCVCEQDDHSEGAQQYRFARDIVCVCQSGQHGGEAL